MSKAALDTWERVRANRLVLADQLETLSDAQANGPSWCAGWRVRDVLGHLVHLAESSLTSMLLDGLRSGTPNRTLGEAARRLGERPVPELCERLRHSANGRFRVPGAPVAVALGEVVMPGNDALRPIGSAFQVVPGDLRPVLDAYRRLARLAFGTTAPLLGSRGQVPHTLRVHFVATDMDWSSGRGPEVEGKAVDLVLLLANRPQVLPSLSGEGTKILAQPR